MWLSGHGDARGLPATAMRGLLVATAMRGLSLMVAMMIDGDLVVIDFFVVPATVANWNISSRIKR